MRLQVTLSGEDLGVFDPDDLTMNVGMQLEDKTGYSIVEFVQNIGRGSARALQALVWVQRLTAGKPGELSTDFRLKDLELKDLDDGTDPTGAGVEPASATDSTKPGPGTSGS